MIQSDARTWALAAENMFSALMMILVHCDRCGSEWIAVDEIKEEIEHAIAGCNGSVRLVPWGEVFK